MFTILFLCHLCVKNYIAQIFITPGSADVNMMVEIFDYIFRHCCFDGPNFGDNVMLEVLNSG